MEARETAILTGAPVPDPPRPVVQMLPGMESEEWAKHSVLGIQATRAQIAALVG